MKAKLTTPITESMDSGIENLIAKGEFTSKTEYVRHLIRDDLRRRSVKEQINAQIRASLASGDAVPADWDAIEKEILDSK